jgi:hypothetical protein
MNTPKSWREDYLRADQISIDDSYQRPLDRERVQRIARAWDDARCGYLEVNQRPDGSYFAMNGQHRLEAARTAKVEYVACRIFTFASVELEALWFAGQAADTRRVEALSRMKARIRGGDAVAVAINRMIHEHGYTFGWSFGKAAPGSTRAAAALEELYRRDAELLDYLLTIMQQAWGDAPNAVSDTTLHGLAFFEQKYHGIYDRARLVMVLKPQEPNVLRQRAFTRAQLSGGGSAERHLMMMIADLYDRGKRTGRLRPYDTEE